MFSILQLFPFLWSHMLTFVGIASSLSFKNDFVVGSIFLSQRSEVDKSLIQNDCTIITFVFLISACI